MPCIAITGPNWDMNREVSKYFYNKLKAMKIDYRFFDYNPIYIDGYFHPSIINNYITWMMDELTVSSYPKPVFRIHIGSIFDVPYELSKNNNPMIKHLGQELLDIYGKLIKPMRCIRQWASIGPELLSSYPLADYEAIFICVDPDMDSETKDCITYYESLEEKYNIKVITGSPAIMANKILASLKIEHEGTCAYCKKENQKLINMYCEKCRKKIKG